MSEHLEIGPEDAGNAGRLTLEYFQTCIEVATTADGTSVCSAGSGRGFLGVSETAGQMGLSIVGN